MQDQTFSANRSEVFEDILCAASYITILPAALFLFIPAVARNPRVRFHACQSVLLNWILTVVVFSFGTAASVERILGGSHAWQKASMLIWSARILCMTVWAIAAICIATGRSFRIRGLASIAQKQANGRFFSRLAPVSAHNSADTQAHAL